MAIYWGNPLVGNDFNPDSFINCHAFSSFSEVIAEVRRLNEDNDAYLDILRQSPFVDGAVNKFIDDEVIYQSFENIFSNKIRKRNNYSMKKYFSKVFKK